MPVVEPPLLPLVLADVPRALRVLLAQDGVPTADWRGDSVAGKYVIFDSRRAVCPPLVPRQLAIDFNEYRQQSATDSLRLWQREESVRGCWKYGTLELTEEIAHCDRATIRREIVSWLRHQVEHLGGIWIRLAPVPFPYRTAFNFRIDYDDYVASDFHRTLQALSGHEDATSHFVCGATHSKHSEALGQLRGLDVGSHGYHHHVYREPQLNERNIGRGIEVLRDAGIEPSGFVAPGGRFNRGLLQAMELHGITHSSEFSFAYDDWPLYPLGSHVLQLPVHPVCLGLFLEAAKLTQQSPDDETAWPVGALAESEAAQLAESYFRRVARAKYLAGEPLLFYGHPSERLGRYPEVIRAILDEVSGYAAVWHTTLTRMAAWWRARAQVQLSVRREDEQLVLRWSSPKLRWRLAAEIHREQHIATVPLDEPTVRLNLHALVFESRRRDAVLQPPRIDHKQDLRGLVRRYLDWEKVTPLDEIDTTSWRGWMKKTLRRVKA